MSDDFNLQNERDRRSVWVAMVLLAALLLSLALFEQVEFDTPAVTNSPAVIVPVPHPRCYPEGVIQPMTMNGCPDWNLQMRPA